MCGFVCLLAAGIALAQQPGASPAAAALGAQVAPAGTGTISGSVMDKDGTAYEGAHAALTSTGAPPQAQQTDSYGRYNFTALAAGTYTLTVSSSGFSTEKRIIVLAAGQSYQAAPIALQVSATTNVHVSASDTPLEIARADVQLEEQQRVLGFIPNFFVTYDPNAPPLNAQLKFQLMWKDLIDPVNFLGAATMAGMEQAVNYQSGYGQGAQGYGKRFGAAYADTSIGDIFSNGIYPALLHQDPRYFYQGTGSIRSRTLHAISSSIICKGDNGRWQPNYSGILGGLTAGSISNLYYPASDRNGAAATFENAALTTAGASLQALFQEFLVKKLTPKLPHYSSGH